jgi:tetratricopeptide (TPR) repeat protein
VTPGPPLVDPDDAAWTRQADHAGALRDLGLHTDAAAAFQALARRSPNPELRARALMQAAPLFEEVGRHRDAVDLYRDAAAEPAVAADALQRLLRAQLRLGAYDDASRTFAEAQARPDAAALTHQYGRLASVVRQRVDLDLRGPLDPAWQLGDPLALRREPDGLALATSAPGLLLSRPVEWSGGLVELSVDVSLLASEWSNDLEIALVADDPDAAPLLDLRAQSSGTSRGGLDVLRMYHCNVAGHGVGYDGNAEVLPETADVPVRFEIRVSATPELGEIGCEVREHGAASGRHHRLRHDAALPPAGRYRLIVRLRNDVPAWLDARLHRIALRGVRLVDEPPADPRRAAVHRALVDGDVEAALAGLDALADATARERVWRADALLQLGRLADARAEWSRVLAAEPLAPDLLARLRAAPAVYGPHLRALDPAGHAARLHAAWRNTAVNHLADPRARQAMALALAPLDPDAALAAVQDDAGRGHVAALLGWRARLWLKTGERARARADLERALALAEALGPDIPQRAERWLLWLELATLAAEAGDRAGALAAVRRARESSDMPLLVGDVVRARPSLAALVEP